MLPVLAMFLACCEPVQVQCQVRTAKVAEFVIDGTLFVRLEGADAQRLTSAFVVKGIENPKLPDQSEARVAFSFLGTKVGRFYIRAIKQFGSREALPLEYERPDGSSTYVYLDPGFRLVLNELLSKKLGRAVDVAPPRPPQQR